MKQSRLSQRAGWHVRETEEAEVNPLEHMANLSDVMLVLAVGILCALLVYWKVDLTGGESAAPSPVTEEDQIDLEIEGTADESLLSGQDLEEYGTVYQDKDGNFYLETKETEEDKS